MKNKVAKCESKFKSKTYNGKQQEIVKMIRDMMNFDPPKVGYGSRVSRFDREVLEPLRNLPKNSGAIFEAFFMCVRRHYERYLQIRMAGHHNIRQMANEISSIKMIENELLGDMF